MGSCLSFLVHRKSNQVRELVGDTEGDLDMERITHITVDIQERIRRRAQQEELDFFRISSTQLHFNHRKLLS